MHNRATVSHDGVVESLTGSRARVRFVAHSACSACHAKGMCSVAESEEKFVDVEKVPAGLSPGDRVQVILEQHQGLKAVTFGYLLPLIILLIVIFTVYAATGRDAFSALIGLGALVPYYLLVYLFRKRISRSFEFRLRKTE